MEVHATAVVPREAEAVPAQMTDRTRRAMIPLTSRLQAWWFAEAPALRLALLRGFIGGYAL